MNRTEDKMWDHFNKAMSEADRAFELADEVFRNAKPGVKIETIIGEGAHTLRFRATTLKERLRLCFRFLKFARQALWTGSIDFKFRPKQ